jgi:hypothetical protein
VLELLQLPVTAARQSFLLAKTVGTGLYKAVSYVASSLRTIVLDVPYFLASKSMRAALGLIKVVGNGAYQVTSSSLSLLRSFLLGLLRLPTSLARQGLSIVLDTITAFGNGVCTATSSSLSLLRSLLLALLRLPTSVLSNSWDIIKAIGMELLSLPSNLLSLLLSGTYQTLLGGHTITSAVIVGLPPPLRRIILSLCLQLPVDVFVRTPVIVGGMSVLSTVVVTQALTTGLNHRDVDFLERHPFLVLPLLPLLPVCNDRTRQIVLSSSRAQANALHAQATEVISAGITRVHERLDEYISDTINRGLDRVDAVVERFLDPAWWWSRIF